MPKPMSFVVAMRDFFGQHPGQTLTDFQKEVVQACGAATDPRRQFWIDGLTANGYTIT
jgi:hypothetical protein